MHMQHWQWVALMSCLLGCVACASVFDPEVRHQVNPEVSFASLAQEPTAHVGQIVILGGTIIEATNLEDATRLVVLQYPTDSRDRPRTDKPSEGRFLVRVPGYLETALYSPDRVITVLGEVQEPEVLPLGDTHYSYPVVEPREIHLWPQDYEAPRVRFNFGIGFGIGTGRYY
jgi:outer membrane lipoprotein